MANGPSAPYPVMGGPSLQSVMARQRMGIEDAMYAAERQRERRSDVLEKGAKGAYEYDKMLRGFMEAKYANPDLTFWDYASKPSVGAAFRKQGRDIIAKKALAGDEIEGMGIGARHKAGLKGIFGRDKPGPTLEELEEMNKIEAGMGGGKKRTQLDALSEDVSEVTKKAERLVDARMEGQERRAMEKAGLIKPEELTEAELYKKFGLEKSDLGEQYEKISDITDKIQKSGEARRARRAYVMPGEKLKDVLGKGRVPVPGDPGRELPSKVGRGYKGIKVPEISDIAVKGGRPDTISLATHTQADIDKRIAEATKTILARKAGGDVAVTGVGDVAVKAAGEKVAKGGLKSALGKAGSAFSLAGGLYAMKKGKTEEARIGGAVSAAGGAAGLIAATNFWNPVGWAAAIPAALSVAGAAYGSTGRKSDSLSRTPLGRYRRRIGII